MAIEELANAPATTRRRSSPRDPPRRGAHAHEGPGRATGAVDAVVRAELKGDPSYDIGKTGAAETIKKTTRKAAKRAASRSRGAATTSRRSTRSRTAWTKATSSSRTPSAATRRRTRTARPSSSSPSVSPRDPKGLGPFTRSLATCPGNSPGGSRFRPVWSGMICLQIGRFGGWMCCACRAGRWSRCLISGCRSWWRELPADLAALDVLLADPGLLAPIEASWDGGRVRVRAADGADGSLRAVDGRQGAVGLGL